MTTDFNSNQAPSLPSFSTERYQLIKALGEGTMGTVYLGRHMLLDKPVAIKCLNSTMGNDPKFYQRFLREARTAASINHPHICDTTDFGRSQEGSVYIVMELLSGQTLQDYIDSEMRVDQARAASIVIQTASALAAAHAQGITHRDLKPDNIFLVERHGQPNFVKILDFGIAQIDKLESGTKLTQDGTILGTPSYMAPEQASGHRIDHRIDLYALGVIFYEMLMGIPPFEGDKILDVLLQHLHDPPPPMTGVSNHVQSIVLRLLSKSPDDRYQSGLEVMHAINDVSLTLDAHAKVELSSLTTPSMPDSTTAEGPALSRHPPSDHPIQALSSGPTPPDAGLYATRLAGVFTGPARTTTHSRDVRPDTGTVLSIPDTQKALPPLEEAGYGEIAMGGQSTEETAIEDLLDMSLAPERIVIRSPKLVVPSLSPEPPPPPTPTLAVEDLSRIEATPTLESEPRLPTPPEAPPTPPLDTVSRDAASSPEAHAPQPAESDARLETPEEETVSAPEPVGVAQLVQKYSLHIAAVLFALIVVVVLVNLGGADPPPSGETPGKPAPEATTDPSPIPPTPAPPPPEPEPEPATFKLKAKTPLSVWQWLMARQLDGVVMLMLEWPAIEESFTALEADDDARQAALRTLVARRQVSPDVIAFHVLVFRAYMLVGDHRAAFLHLSRLLNAYPHALMSRFITEHFAALLDNAETASIENFKAHVKLHLYQRDLLNAVADIALYHDDLKVRKDARELTVPSYYPKLEFWQRTGIQLRALPLEECPEHAAPLRALINMKEPRTKKLLERFLADLKNNQCYGKVCCPELHPLLSEAIKLLPD